MVESRILPRAILIRHYPRLVFDRDTIRAAGGFAFARRAHVSTTMTRLCNPHKMRRSFSQQKTFRFSMYTLQSGPELRLIQAMGKGTVPHGGVASLSGDCVILV